MRTTKRLLAALALAAALSGSGGCYGKFAATGKIYKWNGQATANKLANSAIMWGLFIIPVYELGFLGDFLIFNPIEVLTGSNPMS